MPVLLGVGAVDLGDEVADEGLLVERREIGAQEVVASAEEAVMVDLEEEREKETRSALEYQRGHVTALVSARCANWISTNGPGGLRNRIDRWVKAGRHDRRGQRTCPGNFRDFRATTALLSAVPHRPSMRISRQDETRDSSLAGRPSAARLLTGGLQRATTT